MPSVTVYTSKDASAIDTPTYNWSGTDDHHPVGRTASDLYTARSAIYFPISFTGMQSITSAVLWLRGSHTGSSHCYGDGSSKTMYIRRMSKAWVEGSSTPENTWTNRTNDYTTLEGATTEDQVARSFTSAPVDGNWYSTDITAIVRKWKDGYANQGIVLINSNESDPDAGIEFYSREQGSDYRPYLIVTYASNTAPNAPTSLSPTGDAVISTLTPRFTGVFSDPDAGDTMSGYQIQVYTDSNALLWDSGTIASTTTISRTYAGDTALDYGTFYKWKARTKDAAGVWGPYSSLQRFQTVTLLDPELDPVDPPAQIVGLSATPQLTSIVLEWTASVELEADFDHYEVYRRESGDVEWTTIATIYDIDTPTYEDLTPESGTTYEYIVTQFKNIDGSFDAESPYSDIVEGIISGDVRDEWSVQGADGLAEHSFDLPVLDGPLKTPVQQEIFEPLGTNRKTVVRGKTLGDEGTITCEWDVSERATALEQIEYITENRGPHILRSPFGDVWLVEFSGADRVDLPAGHLRISLAWTEVQ